MNLIDDFYYAFSNLDADTMTKLYHPDIIFKDPAFGELKGERAMNMWRMLCHSQKEKKFIVKHKDVQCNIEKGSANWEAIYTFSQTGKKVHNKITAMFKFKDGLIIEHTDNFDLYKWSKQALGFKGFLIGKTIFFQKKLQIQTNKLLDSFEKSND